jgi:hypothetical protein
VSDWPVDLHGVTETVTTTLGPNERWNAAALGVHAGDPVTARTWGRTRTRGNFERQGRGYVQFVDDPLLFVDAALGIVERDDPVLEEAAAWAAVDVERVATGASEGTEWAEWTLQPVEAAVERESVPTVDRGFGAVVEATVAASRLDEPAYDRAMLTDQLDYLASVVDRCGGERERAAFERVEELSDYP